MRFNPIFVKAGKKFSAVEIGLEIEDVGGPIRILPPAEIVRVRFNEARGLRPCRAEIMQQLAKIGASLRFAGFRPEDTCQLLPRYSNTGMQHKVSDQRLQPSAGEGRNRVPVKRRIEAAE